MINITFRLGELGAKCLHSRVDVDLEDWPVINKWVDNILNEVTKLELTTSVDYLDLSNQTEDSGYSRTKPFTSTMKVSSFSESYKSTYSTLFSLQGEIYVD